MTKEKWILDLAGEDENFIWGCIEKRQQQNIGKKLEKCLIEAKENILLQCRIGETCFA